MNSEAISASQLVKSPDFHAREPGSRRGGRSCSSVMFNEIPPCVKFDESKAAVRGRKEVVGPAVYKKYYRVQWKIRTVHSEGGGTRADQPWSEIEAGKQFQMESQLAASQPGAVSESRTSGQRGKPPWEKPVSAINTVRKSQAASCWGLWKLPLPHMAQHATKGDQWHCLEGCSHTGHQYNSQLTTGTGASEQGSAKFLVKVGLTRSSILPTNTVALTVNV